MNAPEKQEPKVGVYVCHCGLNIAQNVDCDDIGASAADLPDVRVAKGVGYACSEPGQREIRNDIEKHGLIEPIWTYDGKIIDGRITLLSGKHCARG